MENSFAPLALHSSDLIVRPLFVVSTNRTFLRCFFAMSILGCAESIPNGVTHATDAPSLRRPSFAKRICSRAFIDHIHISLFDWS